MARLLFLGSLALLVAGAWFFLSSQMPRSPPKLDPNEWWGPKELKGKTDTSVKPFEVRFSQEVSASPLL